MSEQKITDKTIREKFENFSVEPPEHLWGEISGTMAAGKRRKRIAAIGWIAAAAVVIVAFLAGWLINDHSKQVLPAMVEQQTIQENNQDEAESQPQSQESESQIQEQQVIADNEVQAGNSESEKTKNSLSSFVAEKVIANSETESHYISTSKRYIRNIEYLAFIKAEFKQENLSLSMKKKQTKLNDLGISEQDQLLIASNIQDIKNEKESEHGWIVGGHVSPGYASHTSSYSSGYSSNMSTNSVGGVRNTGGGVSVQYKTGKKLRIESGVYFAQNSQSTGSSRGLFSMSPSYDYFPDMANGVTGERFYSNIVELKQSGMSMNSTAGVVNIVQTPAGAELSANTTADYALNTATLLTSSEFTQQFDFIEIPMYLRYRVLDKKFGIDLMGGLNAGLVVGNNVFVSSDYGRENVGTTEDISTLNLSGTLGMGVSYSLGTHLSFALEPRMSYYLNSINTNPEVSYKPYRLGLFTGVYYQF